MIGLSFKIINLKFSERIGKTTSIKNLQLEDIDVDLRNGLWNIIKSLILDKLERISKHGLSLFFTGTQYYNLCMTLWHNFYKLTKDSIPDDPSQAEKYIRDRYFKSEWYEVYELLEFMALFYKGSHYINAQSFMDSCNVILEREFAGYRFLEEKIVPITNKIEIEEIENAIKQTGGFSPFNGANIHLKSALEKLSDKKNQIIGIQLRNPYLQLRILQK